MSGRFLHHVYVVGRSVDFAQWPEVPVNRLFSALSRKVLQQFGEVAQSVWVVRQAEVMPTENRSNRCSAAASALLL